MKIALVEPYVPEKLVSLRAYPDKSEPTHLLGMYNLLSRNGIEVEIIDAYSYQMSEQELIEKIVKGMFTHVGFTTYDYKTCLSYLSDVIKALSGKVVVILGGPGPTYTPDRILSFFRPDWMIRGEGEKALLDLVLHELNANDLSRDTVVTRSDGTFVVYSTPMSLDDIPFERPYSLEFYDYVASPRLQKGCRGKCIFCCGAYQKNIEYRSPQNALRLIEYLVYQKKATIITPDGPDFTASPDKANRIIGTVVEASIPLKKFSPEVCLHTLASSIRKAPDVWRKLGSMTQLNFETSIDSFLYQRLKRLGKNVPKDFVDNIFDHIEKILESCECTIMISRIAIDPFITIDEFLAENSLYIRLLERFGDRVTIGGMLMNDFKPVWGTPSMAKGEYDNPWAQKDVLIDPIMAEFKKRFLDNHRFKEWCKLAEALPKYNERNLVFREILRVTNEYATKIHLKGCAHV